MEYEQAEKLKKYIEQLQADAFEEGFKTATKELSKQMSAIEDGQIRHGQWMETIDEYYECSKCGGSGDKWMGYCPHCGAKMDEEVE